MRRVMKLLGGLLGIGLLVAAVVVLSDLVYWRRLVTAPLDGGVTATEWYAPLERIPGAPLADTIPAAREPSFARSALDAALQYAAQTESVALLVYHRGKLVLEHYWPGYGPDTRTDPASMHKTILAMAVGAAIQDGLIDSVEAPAARWLTEWNADERADIRVRHLLQMASGLELVPFSFNPFGGYFKFLLGTDIVSRTLRVPAAEPPGTFAYNNINSQALGILLERAVGRRYAQYLHDRLWSRLAAGPAFVWLDREGGMPRTFCCIQTTARGWLQVGRLILEEGSLDGQRILPVDWIRAMTAPSPANPNYGYQIWLGSKYVRDRAYNRATQLTAFHSEPFASDDLVYLDGFGGQRVYISPSHELVIVRTGKAQLDWDDARLPNTLIRGITGAEP